MIGLNFVHFTSDLHFKHDQGEIRVSINTDHRLIRAPSLFRHPKQDSPDSRTAFKFEFIADECYVIFRAKCIVRLRIR